MPNVLKLANYHSAKAPPPTHVLGCQCLALRHYKGQAVQSFELLVSPAAALWHPQLRKTCSKRAFPLPRAHMHTHAASERADTHMCLTRKQARHLPDILCGLTSKNPTGRVLGYSAESALLLVARAIPSAPPLFTLSSPLAFLLKLMQFTLLSFWTSFSQLSRYGLATPSPYDGV